MPKKITDPVCRLCGRLIQSGSQVYYEHGELTHVPCVLQVKRQSAGALPRPSGPSTWPRSWSR